MTEIERLRTATGVAIFITQLCLDDLRKLVNDGNYEDCKEFALVAKQNAETVCKLVFDLMEADKEEDEK